MLRPVVSKAPGARAARGLAPAAGRFQPLLRLHAERQQRPRRRLPRLGQGADGLGFR